MATPVNIKLASRPVFTLLGIAVLVAFTLIIVASCSSASDGPLADMADKLDELAGESLDYTVDIDETISIDTEVTLNEDLTIPIDTTVDLVVPIDAVFPLDDLTVPVDTAITINEVFVVPIELSLEDLLPASLMEIPAMEAAIPLEAVAGQMLPIDAQLLDQSVNLPLNVQIDQDYIIETELFGQPITVPLTLNLEDLIVTNANLPVGEALNIPLGVALSSLIPNVAEADLSDHELVVAIPTAQEILALIPADQRSIQFEVPIVIDREIPIQMDVAVPLSNIEGLPINTEVSVAVPIQQEIKVPINQTFPLQVEAPIRMQLPINIPLSETSIGPILEDLAQQLRSVNP